MFRALHFAVAWRTAPDAPPGAQAFFYHRGLRPMLVALIAACLLEMVGAHVAVFFLISRPLAWGLMAASLLSLAWLVGLLNSLAKLPILVTDRGVRVRTGLLIDQWLPVSQIVGVRTGAAFGNLKRPEVLRACPVAYPNTLLDLDPPLALRRGGRARNVTTVALRPDDPGAFASAVAALRGGD